MVFRKLQIKIAYCQNLKLEKKKIQSFRHIDSMGAFASPLGDCTFSLV